MRTNGFPAAGLFPWILDLRLFAASPVPIVLTAHEVPGATVIEGKAEGDSFLGSSTGGEILSAGDVNGGGVGDLAFQGATVLPGPGEDEGYILFGAPGPTFRTS